ncbi:hypothetical protein [Oricola cellulosilytica]|uniref:Uncharacterized protein n=1 Tax=Oricola cellulosilytica TaxID=1429082 RepID=A0A4R0PAU9_9HYPH|nr:hypothetical protein [Oricola cellulosilytica]TCD14166.1 hypothetical protein E0D97_08740 [Oricola cellulosilytica]
MKTLLTAAAIAIASTTTAFAASSALDVYEPVNTQSAIDYTATAAIGAGAADLENDRLGDGSPRYPSNNGRIDFTATSSVGAPVGQSAFGLHAPRLGDGSPLHQ